MFEIFGIPSAALFGQLLIGLINGSFYALLSLGLAVIFGMLNIINFSHGAQYMLGVFAAYLLLQYSGIGYWPALIVAPVLVGITGMIVERLFLQRHCPCCRGRRRGAWLDGRAHRAKFFTDPIFSTRFPTELLTTGWEMAL